MKVLLYLKDEILADIAALALEGMLSSECFLALTPEEAIARLGAGGDVDLLVFECDQSAHPVFDLARRRKIPLVRLTGPNGDLRPSGIEGEFTLVKPLDVRNFLELVRIAVKGDPAQPKDDRYCRVRLDTLLLGGTVNDFEVYVRLSEVKYVRVLKRGDPFDGAKYTQFHAKGVSHLYVPKDQFLSYLSGMANSLHSMLANDNFTLVDAMKTSTQVYEAFREGMNALGITPDTQRVLKLTIDLAIRSIEKNPTLKQLFANLSANQDSFQAWHSIALAYVAGKLSSLMTWDSQNTHYKLALASMLHDVALPNAQWAEFRTLAEAEAGGLSPAELAIYARHPEMACELARQLKDYPGDVDYIIGQHHERPDGSGFPLGLTHAKISPLSSLFIVAHDICFDLYREGPGFDFARFLSHFDDRYPHGYFRKIRQALEKIDAKELSG